MGVVVITGATAGLGKATALRFARAGFNVGIIARDDHSLAVAREEVARHGVKCHTVNADVADAQAIMTAAQEMEQHLGSIDVWVNNAMCGVLAPFRAMEDDEFRRVTDVTYLGYVNGTRAALAVMTPRESGMIIQVGSAMAYRLSLHSPAISLLRCQSGHSRFYRRGADRADSREDQYPPGDGPAAWTQYAAVCMGAE